MQQASNLKQPTASSATVDTNAADMDVEQTDDGTYASVLNNFCMAIIDQRQPGQMCLLNQARFDTLSGCFY